MTDGEPLIVTCAGCAQTLPASEADVVDYGTGYRCERCTLGAEVKAHLEQAARNEAAERGSRDKVGFYESPSLKRVIAEVEKAEAQAPVEGTAALPTPEQLEPVLEADDDRRAEWAAGVAPPATTRGSSIDESSNSTNPYRATPTELVRYVCIACFESCSDIPGDCPTDRVPLSDLENPEVVDDLRAHVRRKINRRESWRFGVLFTFWAIASLVAGVGLNIMGGRGGLPALIGMIPTIPLAILSYRLFPSRKVANNAHAMVQFLGLRVIASKRERIS
jgi:hypothetical protein